MIKFLDGPAAGQILALHDGERLLGGGVYA